MKKTKTMKTRIIAGVLSAITVFSVGTVATTSASALSAKSIAKDISSFAITQTIDKFLSNSIKGSLLKMGTGYLLDWVFDSKEEKEPTVSDAIEKIPRTSVWKQTAFATTIKTHLQRSVVTATISP